MRMSRKALLRMFLSGSGLNDLEAANYPKIRRQQVPNKPKLKGSEMGGDWHV